MASMAVQLAQVLLEIAAQDHGAGVFHLTADLTDRRRVYVIPDCAYIPPPPPKEVHEQQPEHR